MVLIAGAIWVVYYYLDVYDLATVIVTKLALDQ